jgi:hypothetical protein
MHSELVRLFQDGKASPSDMDRDGNTALHVRFHPLMRQALIKTSSEGLLTFNQHLARFVARTMRIDDDRSVQAARGMFLDLSKRNMIIDQPNNNEETIADILVSGLAWDLACQRRVESGGILPLGALDIFSAILDAGGYLTHGGMGGPSSIVLLSSNNDLFQIQLIQEVVEYRPAG